MHGFSKDHCFHQDLYLIHDSSVRQAPYGLKLGSGLQLPWFFPTTTHHPMYLYLPVATPYHPRDESLAWPGMSQHANSSSQHLQVLGVAQLPNQRSKENSWWKTMKSVLIPSLMNSGQLCPGPAIVSPFLTFFCPQNSISVSESLFLPSCVDISHVSVVR